MVDEVSVVDDDVVVVAVVSADDWMSACSKSGVRSAGIGIVGSELQNPIALSESALTLS